MINWTDKFKNLDIFFVTADVKRALGIEDRLPRYHIICSAFDPLIPILRQQGAKIFCLEEEMNIADKINNSGSLLNQSLATEYIRQHAKQTPYIMYFKPSLKLDLLIKNKGYIPIGNRANLNEQFENKLLAHKLILENVPQFTINTLTGVLGKLSFTNIVKQLGLPFVIQFGHGWAGKTTFFIEKDEEFNNLVKKFASTKVKVSQKIEGYTVLNNCCIYKKQVFNGPVAMQISDIPALYSKPGVTCGRQWPARFLTSQQLKDITYISQIVGRLMEKAGFRGFFGLDFLIEESTGRIFISEINARLTASASFYTYLERELGETPLLVYHLAAFLEQDLALKDNSTFEITGSQIILRKNTDRKTNNKLADFGVYKIEDGRPILAREDYFPGKLKSSEFIYLKRSVNKKQKEGEEVARIETRQEVLKTPRQLKVWLREFLNQSGTNKIDNHQK